MRREYLIFLLVLFLVIEPLGASQPQVMDVTWAQLREEVAARRLNGRGITVRLTAKRWPSDGPEARVPRPEVQSIRFAGRQGHGGLIGGLAGLGAGGAIIGTAVAATPPGEGQGGGAAIIALPAVFGFTGYLIGRHYDKRIPEFRIVP